MNRRPDTLVWPSVVEAMARQECLAYVQMDEDVSFDEAEGSGLLRASQLSALGRVVVASSKL